MPHKPFDEKKPVVPKRRPAPYDRGHIGKPIDLKANWFILEATKLDVKIYHFDVNIDLVNEEEASLATERGNVPGLSPEIIPEEASTSEGAKPKRRRKKGRKGGNRGGGESSSTGTVEEDVVQEGVTNQSCSAPGRRIPKYKLRLIFSEFIKQNDKIFSNHPFAFDGEKNAYSVSIPNQLKEPFSSFVGLAERGDDNPKTLFKITIGLAKGGKGCTILSEYFKDVRAGKQLTSCTSYIGQALEVIFNYGRCMRFETIGRNKFFSKTTEFGPSTPLGNGVEGKNGFYGSLRPVTGQGQWKDATPLMLNLDMAHAAFYQEIGVIKFIRELNGRLLSNLDGSCTESERKKIEKLLVEPMIKVEAKHYKSYTRKFVVKGIGPETSFYKFEVDGKLSTVIEYFKKVYKLDIRYPNLPCLKVGKNGENCMPMELCSIAPNQRVKGKLTDAQTAEFIKKTAVRPQDRLNTISKIISCNRFSEDQGLKDLGFVITPTPIELKGRVLPAPTVKMDQKVPVRDGKWDPRRNKFHTPAAITNWAILDFSRNKPGQLDNFISKLVPMAISKGMQVHKPLTNRAFPNQDPEVILKSLLKNFPDCKFVLCVIEANNQHYNSIKTVGDRELKIVTQCVKQINVFKCQDATIGNILLKINAKLGGTCFTSNSYDNMPTDSIPNLRGYDARAEVQKIPKIFNDQHVMIMGADVNHPAPNDKTSPSLVAVVGSCNVNASLYALEVRHQINRTEVINDLKSITEKLLKHYRDKNNFYPQKIVMYRDGVSDSQFTKVLSVELLAMRQACTEILKNYQPSITFICVQKRHNTRLFVRNPRDACGRSGNIPPGTVVDDVITHPLEADFFLCSHEGIQGTSKPSHYHVLWDDGDSSADFIQLLTYSLCHTYTRCTRAVSIPTPAYYAHLAAFRAKIHLAAKIGSAPFIRKDEDAATNEKYVEFLDHICNVSADGIGKDQYYI